MWSVTKHFVLEKSLAAMTKSKYGTFSRNPFLDVYDDDDDDGSKNDAFLDRIFGESGEPLLVFHFFFFFSFTSWMILEFSF